MDTSQNRDLSSSIGKRLYQIWPGKNQFFLDGRLMLGPSDGLKWQITTLFTLIVLQFLFILFICPYLWYKVSKTVPILSVQLFFFSVIFMFLAMTTDPGIIPRREVFQSFGSIPEVLSSEGEDKRKYCKTCNIYRPARSSHCRNCANCVEVFDHHCGVLNTCIGKNNYKWFFGLLVGVTLLGGLNICGLFLFFFYNGGEDRAKRSRNIYIVVENDTLLVLVAVVLTLAIFLMTLFVLLLCLFHSYISLSGETTKEYSLNLGKGINGGLINGKYWFHPRLVIHTIQI